jgi:hypothetical protein
MIGIRIHAFWVAWLLIGAIALSSALVTVAGFQEGNTSLFDFLTSVMIEEETEETERSETENELEKEINTPQLVPLTSAGNLICSYFKAHPIVVHPEITSPPPEA